MHFFHHATIGPIWWYVLRNVENIEVAAYSFGAMVNSLVHMLMYSHFFIKATPLCKLYVPLTLCGFSKGKILSVGWSGRQILKVVQLVQCILCAGHAA